MDKDNIGENKYFYSASNFAYDLHSFLQLRQCSITINLGLELIARTSNFLKLIQFSREEQNVTCTWDINIYYCAYKYRESDYGYSLSSFCYIIVLS